jgi:hypothetical protein
MSLRADMYPSESGRGQAERGASKKPIHETGSSLEFCFNLGRFCLTLFLFFDGGQALLLSFRSLPFCLSIRAPSRDNTDLALKRRRNFDGHEIVRIVEPATAIIVLCIEPIGADDG